MKKRMLVLALVLAMMVAAALPAPAEGVRAAAANEAVEAEVAPDDAPAGEALDGGEAVEAESAPDDAPADEAVDGADAPVAWADAQTEGEDASGEAADAAEPNGVDLSDALEDAEQNDADEVAEPNDGNPAEVNDFAGLQAAVGNANVSVIKLTSDFAIPDDKDITITRAVTLDLNGQTLSYSGSGDAFNIVFSGAGNSAAHLTIKDSAQGGGGKLQLSGEYACAAYVYSGALLTMESGAIDGGARGVSVHKNGIFNMTGGTISGAKLDGVYVNCGGTFTMNGGTISGAKVDGVDVESGGTFTMTGGTISRCLSGVSTVNDSKLNLSGSPRVTGNTGRNINLDSVTKITVTGELTRSAAIGVTPNGGFAEFIVAGENYTLTSSDVSRFFSDDSSKTIELQNNVVQLSDGHKHGSITFTAWDEANSLPVSGSYYLTRDVTISGSWNVPADKVNLCLNGHSITKTGSSEGVINLKNGAAVLNLYDTPANNGTITHQSGSGIGVWVNTGTFNMYGGTITGNGHAGGNGGGVLMDGVGTFNMYGGKITENALTGNGNGGGVYVGGGTFNVLGPVEISGNTRKVVANNVYLPGSATLKIGAALGDGANIYVTAENMPRAIVEAVNGYTITEDDLAKLHSDGNQTFRLNAFGGIMVGYGVKCVARNGTVEADKYAVAANAGEDERKVTLTLRPNSGYEFGSLTVKDSGGADVPVANNTFTMPENKDVTVTATFKAIYVPPPTYTVRFVSGDATVASPSVVSGSRVTPPADPTPPEGMRFDGWFAEGAETAFDFAASVTASLTLYARFSWIPVEVYPTAEVVYDPATGALAVTLADGEQTLPESAFSLTFATEGRTCVAIITPAEGQKYRFDTLKIPIPTDLGGFMPATLTSAGKTSLSLKYTAVPGAAGYDLRFGPVGGEQQEIEITASPATLDGLVNGAVYEASLAAYVKVGDQKVYVSESPVVRAIAGGSNAKYANPKAVKIDKKTRKLSLKTGKGKKIKAGVTKSKKSKRLLNGIARLRYYSDDANVATVSAKGKVKAVGKGKCKIYVIAANGAYKTVAVTVK